MPSCQGGEGGARCPQHTRPRRPFARRKTKTHRRGSTRAWRRERAHVLAEEPRCRRCGGASTVADHIVPLAEGGTDMRGNLQGLCAACHATKTAAESQRSRSR